VWTTEFCVVSLCQTDSFAEIIMVQTHPISAPRLTCPSPTDRGGGGANRRHGLPEGEAGVRSVHVVVHGGRVGWGRRLGTNRESRTGGGEATVCVFIAVYHFLFSVRW
jgi:hypothetical protein